MTTAVASQGGTCVSRQVGLKEASEHEFQVTIVQRAPLRRLSNRQPGRVPCGTPPWSLAFDQRQNSVLGYRTLNGAQVGDLFMTLIHTCQLCGANSLEYLTELQRHARELELNLSAWTPWNYRETIEQIGI